MSIIRKISELVNKNIIVRNVVLAACAIIVLSFVLGILLNLITRHGQVYEVPDFASMTLAEAEKAADNADLELEVSDSLYLPSIEGGSILEQNPAPGARVKSGRRIFLTINSFSQRKAEIPYVSGYSLRQAKNLITAAGFEIEELIYKEDIATNNVLEQKYEGRSIGANSSVMGQIGSGITLIVGVEPGSPSPTIPKVVGFPIREAKSRLWEAGYNIGIVVRDQDVTMLNLNDAKVYKQDPANGLHDWYGTKVNLYIALEGSKIEDGIKAAEKAAAAAARDLELKKEEEQRLKTEGNNE